MIGGEPLLKRVGVVVASLDQWFACDVVLHGVLGWVEHLVVGSAGSGVDETTCYPRDEQTVVDLELDGVLERFLGAREHGVETFCLRDCAWEAIEDEAVDVSVGTSWAGLAA